MESVMSAAQPNDEAIREKAYYLWEEDGKPHGRDHEYWQRAVVALSTSAKMSTLPKPAPKHAVEGKPKASPKAAEPKKAAASKSKAGPTKTAKSTGKKPKKK
jgi:hypothetical protein